MTDEVEKQWEQMQIANWRNDENEIILFFKRFNLDVRDVYRHVTSIDYDRMQAICYLLSKIDKAIKICDFLDILADNNNEDVDVIKIYMLISHAEITSRSLGENGVKIELVRRFFNPVEADLKYKIVPNISPDRKTLAMNFADILYKIRCEYTHEGNYTGRIFKRDEDNADSLLIRFKDNGKELFGECGIVYKDFLEIYMRALIANIRIFSGYTNPQVR